MEGILGELDLPGLLSGLSWGSGIFCSDCGLGGSSRETAGSSGMSTVIEGQVEGGREFFLRAISPVSITFLISGSCE